MDCAVAAQPAVYATVSGTGVVSSPNNHRQPRCAFVTFLDGANQGYIDGAFAIARALKRHGSRFPLVVAATPSVPQAALDKLVLETNVAAVRRIELLELPEGYARGGTSVLLYQQFLANFSKLRMWEWGDEYDKLVYLDSDVLPMRNIDDMFLAPHFSACQDNMMPDACVTTDECQAPGPLNKAPNRTKSAYFNAGIFVFEPSLEELAEMLEMLQSYKITRYAEQDFLNDFYRGRWNMLPMSYNWGRVSFFVCPELYDPATVKIVHFSGPAKPWRRAADGSWPEMKDAFDEEKQLLRDPNSNFSQAVDKWWAAFTDDIVCNVKDLEAKPQPMKITAASSNGTTAGRAALARPLAVRKPSRAVKKALAIAA
eukprot:jgi/Tetstr1/423356/TSEL_014049.t1